MFGALEEHRRRDGEVEDGELRSLERSAQSRVQVVVHRIATDVRESREEGAEDVRVQAVLLRGLDCGPRVVLHLVVAKRPATDADDRAREDALFREVVEGGQGLRAREIARDPEDDEGVGGLAHDARRSLATERSMSTPSSRSSTRMRSFAEWTSFVASSGSMSRIGKKPYATVPNVSRR